MSFTANDHDISPNASAVMRDESIISSECGDHQSFVQRREHGSTQRVSPSWIGKRNFKAAMMASTSCEHYKPMD